MKNIVPLSQRIQASHRIQQEELMRTVDFFQKENKQTLESLNAIQREYEIFKQKFALSCDMHDELVCVLNMARMTLGRLTLTDTTDQLLTKRCLEVISETLKEAGAL